MAGGFLAYHEPGSKYLPLVELAHGLTVTCSCRDFDYHLIFLFPIVCRVVFSENNSCGHYWPNCRWDYIWEAISRYS